MNITARMAPRLTVGLLLLLILPALAPMAPVSGATINWPTDRTIGAGTTETYVGDTIIMSGNLNIDNGGTLILSGGATLQVAFSSRWIHVQNGGTLIIDNSLVTSAGWTTRYYFRAYWGSTLKISNSTILNCGVGTSFTNDQRGLYIATDNADIYNSTFREDGVGMLVWGAKPSIRNNLITMNEDGGIGVDGGGDPLIENNTITFNVNQTYTRLAYPAGIVVVNSNARIYNNTIANNTRRVTNNQVGGGIGARNSPNAVIINNTIRDNVANMAPGQNPYTGMYIEGGRVLIDGNLISGHREGARVRGAATATIANNTFTANNLGAATSAFGLVVTDGSTVATVLNNSFTRNGVGMQSISSAAVTARNNLFSENLMYGVQNSNSASLTATNNTFTGNGAGLAGAGLQSSGSAIVVSLNNNFTGNDYGIMIVDSGQFTSTNDIVRNSGLRGVSAEAGNRATSVFYNGTVSSNVPNQYDVYIDNRNSQNGPDVTFINTTFSKDAVIVKGSGTNVYFRVKWYLQARVAWERGTLPAPNSSVNATSAFSSTIRLGLTNDTGLTQPVLVEEYNITGQQPLASSPYTVTADWGRWSNSTWPVTVSTNTLAGVTLDDVPPVLTITAPQNGQVTGQSEIQVSGRTEPGAAVQVNGNPVTVLQSGNFSTTVSLASEGPNTLVLESGDAAGNTNQTVLVVNRDSKKPTLTVKYPSQNFIVNRSLINIAGESDEPSAVLTVNGVNMGPVNRSFSIPIELSETLSLNTGLRGDGTKQIDLELRDAAGNSATAAINGTLDTVPPALRINSPADGFITNSSNITVSGSTESGSTVLVNGKNVNSGQESFTYTYRLNRGENILDIVATDKAGNFAEMFLRVVYDPDPPLLLVAYPPDNLLTNDPVLPIQIKTRTGIRITINDEVIPYTAPEFNLTVTLQKGVNLFTFAAADANGNAVRFTRRVTLDTDPPTLLIQSPANNTATNLSSLAIVGTTDPGAVVSIGGESTAVDEWGAFTFIVALKEGVSTFLITARDAAGNTHSTVRVVSRETYTPLVITTSLPKNTGEPSVTVAGKVKPGSNLTVNGRAYAIGGDGQFTINIVLDAGVNLLTFRTVDQAGNVNQTTVSIIRTTPSTKPSAAVAGSMGSTPVIIGLLAVVIVLGAIAAIAIVRGRAKAPLPQPQSPPPSFAPVEPQPPSSQLPPPPVPPQNTTPPPQYPPMLPPPQPGIETGGGPAGPYGGPPAAAPVDGDLARAEALLFEVDERIKALEERGIETDKARHLYNLARVACQETDGEKALKNARKANTLISEIRARNGLER